MVFLQPLLEPGAKVETQHLDRQKEARAGGDPLSSIEAQAAAGHEVVNVRMIDEGARPGVEHAQHSQLRAQSFGIGGQILQGLRAAGKEQVQPDLLMRADEEPQGFRHGEGQPEARHGPRKRLRLTRLKTEVIGEFARGVW